MSTRVCQCLVATAGTPSSSRSSPSSRAPGWRTCPPATSWPTRPGSRSPPWPTTWAGPSDCSPSTTCTGRPPRPCAARSSPCPAGSCAAADDTAYDCPPTGPAPPRTAPPCAASRPSRCAAGHPPPPRQPGPGEAGRPAAPARPHHDPPAPTHPAASSRYSAQSSGGSGPTDPSLAGDQQRTPLAPDGGIDEANHGVDLASTPDQRPAGQCGPVRHLVESATAALCSAPRYKQRPSRR
jgi:hypothetical protein